MEKVDWKSLTKKQQWDCLVALRGPDIRRSEVIKYFTTGVIRLAMGKFMRVGGQLSELGFVVVPKGPVFAGLKNLSIVPDLNHFVTHVWEAADILGVPVIQVSADVWEAMTTQLTSTGAMVIFLKWAKANKDDISKTTFDTCIVPLLKSYSLKDEVSQ